MAFSATMQAIFAAAESGATVLTANRRAARQLRADFDRLQASRGLRIWRSPDFISWSGWMSRLWRQHALDASAPLPAILSAAQEARLWETIVGSDAKRRNVARLAGDAWRLAHQYRLALHSPSIRGNFQRHEGSEAFLAWSREFSRRCAELKLVSTAEVPAALLREAEHLALPKALLTVGFDALTPQQHALLKGIEARGVAWRQVPLSSAAIPVVVAVEDSEDELRAAARWAHHQLLRNPEASLGIVLPKLAGRRAAAERVLTAYLQPQNVLSAGRQIPAFHISLSRALTDQPLIATALLLLRWCTGSLELDEISVLLRSPFLKAGDAEAAQRAQLDVELHRRNSPRLSAQAVQRCATRHPDAAYASAALGKLLRSVEQFPALPRMPSEWREAFVDLLKTCGWPGPRPINSAEFQVQQKWMELLRDFAALDEITGVLDSRRAMALLIRMAGEVAFEQRDSGAPVQIMGALEAAGSEFDSLWVCGLDAENWPLMAPLNPFLPPELQRRYGMPHCSAEADIEFGERVLHRLAASAGDVVFSYAKQDGDRELRAHPAIANYPTRSRDEMAPPVSTWYEFLPFAAEVAETPPAPPFSGEIAEGGSQVLRLQAACPFRAFAEIRLHARRMEAPDDGLNRRERGKLLHCIMKALWEGLRSQQALLALSDDELQTTVERAIDAGLRESALALGDALREQFRDVERRRLAPIILAWLEEEGKRSPFTVISLEEKRECNISGVRVNITRDRIDQLADGRRILLDYKTGELPARAWEGDRPLDPQLPLYALAEGEAQLAGIAFAQLKVGKIGFRGVQSERGLLPGRIEVLPRGADGEDGISAELSRWRAVLGTLAADFLAGEAAVDPKNGRETCRFCSLPAFCRIAERDPAGFNLEENGNE